MLLGEHIRKEFPIFADPSLVYLDTGASAQKPRAVIDAISSFYQTTYANIHRGVYGLSERSTILYDEVREKVARFLNVSSSEIIFTPGTTGGINLVASSWGRRFLKPGDELIVSLFEHHANFVPWQVAAEHAGATVRYWKPGPDERLSLDDFRKLLSKKTKLVALTQLANSIGLAPPLREVLSEAHAAGARVMVDGAQGICHGEVDLRALDADFYAFSAHKLYGPTGLGILFGKSSVLDEMPPFLTGGDMIRRVTIDGSEFADPPQRFEAGTPDIAGVVGLGAALDFVSAAGRNAIAHHEAALVSMCESGLRKLPGVRVLGPEGEHHGLVVFHCDGVHPHDLAQALAAQNVCVRAGHHCNQPLLDHLCLPATTRMSFGMYNSEQDVERALSAVSKALQFFRR